MDSIVREIVTRSGAETRVPESPTQSIGVGAEDAELERILASLRTNIKIVGIGGGGCNTIDRLVESGIVGAELYAANTDAQHLLIIRSPHKLLLGRRVTRGLGAGALPQVVVIPNDKLLELVPRLALNAAFKVADDVLMRAIKGITEVITKPGLVNLDFNDIKTIMKGGGVAMIGLGESDTDNRAEESIEEAINSPLIDVDISAATGALVNVTGGNDMSVSEAEKVAEIVQGRIAPNARIIWGAAVDPSLEHKLRVMLILTGVRSKQILGPGEHVRAHGGVDIVPVGTMAATWTRAGGYN